MVEVTFFKHNDLITGFTFDGHAGYADAGYDIVCSAVSALVITAINSVEALTEDGFATEAKEEGGYVSFYFDDEPSKEASLLMDSLAIGIEGIFNSYEDYIHVDFREV